jgi:A/G-specific adenine glycosylase
VADEVLAWFDRHARDLPWRSPGTTAWGVLVSEVMLQQTPVARVVPVYTAWLRRWPGPRELAAAPAAEAIRAWGRMGYPRRAVRLHAAACTITERHGGQVPQSLDQLRDLPGVGEYTAAAVAAFAFGQRVPVLDVNVRRVLGRAWLGEQHPQPHLTNAERALAEAALPAEPAVAARWSAAVMELGAVVCTSRQPACAACPLAERCVWVASGRPAAAARRRSQGYAGTDRQARGRLLAVLRDAPGPVPSTTLDEAWEDAEQRERALHSLLSDGLVVRDGARWALPA